MGFRKYSDRTLLLQLSDPCGCTILVSFMNLCEDCIAFINKSASFCAFEVSPIFVTSVPSKNLLHATSSKDTTIVALKAEGFAVPCPDIDDVSSGTHARVFLIVPLQLAPCKTTGRKTKLRTIRFRKATLTLSGQSANDIDIFRGLACVITAVNVSAIHGTSILRVRTTPNSILVLRNSPQYADTTARPIPYLRRIRCLAPQWTQNTWHRRN